MVQCQYGDGKLSVLTEDDMKDWTEGYRKVEEWKRDGKDFVVSVKRHTRPDFNGDYSRVIGERNCWAIYLYIYPGNSRFDLFRTDGNVWDQPYYEVHSYASLFKTHRRNNGDIASFQLGWDYSHDGDIQYEEYSTPDQAWRVFSDANRLYDQASGNYKD
jgi:hypothetical protein